MAAGRQLVGGHVNLKELRSALEGPSDDARFSAWTTLYTSTAPEAYQEIERIVSGADPVLKVMLVRFLGHVDEERAVALILILLENQNEVVFHAARKAFEQNRYLEKLRKLLPLIHSPSTAAKQYAIDVLSFAGETRVIEPLLKLLDTAPGPLQLKILVALRYLPDPRVLPVLLTYLAKEDLKYHALLALGTNYEAQLFHDRNLLHQLLKDPSPQIRQAVLWVLQKRPNLHDIPILCTLSLQDPDPMVRQEALLSLVPFPRHEVIAHLVQVMITDQTKAIVLKAESILLKMPLKVLLRSLRRLLRHPKKEVRYKVILLLAELELNTTRHLGFLKKRLQQTTSEQERLILLQALGTIRNPTAIPILEKYLEGSLLVSYAALGSLLRLYPPQRLAETKKYLADPKLGPLLKQMVLKYLISHGHPELIDSELVSCLLTLLEDENLNVRYLAAQVLAISGQYMTLEPMFHALLCETDPTSLEFFKKSVVELFRVNPEASLTLLGRYQTDHKAVALLLTLIEATGQKSPHALLLAASLLNPPFALLQTEHQAAFLEIIISFLKQHRCTLVDLVQAVVAPETEQNLMFLLVARLGRDATVPLKIPFELLEPWLQQEDAKRQEAAIELAGFSQDRRAITHLVALLSHQGKATFHSPARRALQRLVGSG